jgi:hypothetical protein
MITNQALPFVSAAHMCCVMYLDPGKQEMQMSVHAPSRNLNFSYFYSTPAVGKKREEKLAEWNGVAWQTLSTMVIRWCLQGPSLRA